MKGFRGFPNYPNLGLSSHAGITRSFASDAVAPHGATSRFSYTVPLDRRAYLTGGVIDIIRNSAPTTAGLVRALIVWGTLTTSPPYLSASFFSGTVGDGRSLSTSAGLLLAAGATVTGFTQDNSTGGNVNYRVGVIALEFPPIV